METKKTFFEDLEPWKKEWQGMPEFSHEDLTPWKQIIVSFATEEDMQDFAKLVEQNLTIRTQSIWYPPAEIGRISNKRFDDEVWKEKIVGKKK